MLSGFVLIVIVVLLPDGIADGVVRGVRRLFRPAEPSYVVPESARDLVGVN
jgi:hypothetical protein